MIHFAGTLGFGDLASLSGADSLFADAAKGKLERLQAELLPLAERYDVVVANPPYMGSNNMNKWLADWTKRAYPASKRDLCTCFIERGQNLAIARGYEALITSDTCMYISSFEQLRKNILSRSTIVCFIDTRGTNAHPDVFDANAGWVLHNAFVEGVKGSYFKLNQAIAAKEAGYLEALANPNCGWLYHLNAALYSKLPGSPIVYWISPSFQNLCFDYVPLERNVYFKEGITTGDNETYLRLWHEVSNAHFYSLSDKGSVCATRSWIPCNKGGAFRRWYGNNDYVIDWTNDGNDLAAFPRSSFRNASYQRKEGVSYSNLSTGLFAARYSPTGFAFESKGTTCFSEDPFSTLAYLNSSIFGELTKYVCPTLDFKFGILQKLPDLQIAECSQIAKKCVQYTKEDWDSFETSWEFHSHPLV